MIVNTMTRILFAWALLATNATASNKTSAGQAMGLIENLFAVKDVRLVAPSIIIKNKIKLILSTTKINVIEENPDWGMGDSIDIVFGKTEREFAITDKDTQSITNQATKNNPNSKPKPTTVKMVIERIRRGEKVGKVRIPFATFVKIGKDNRSTLRNHVVIKGDDDNDYHPYNGITAVPIPVSIDTLMLLIAESLEFNKVHRLKYLKGKSIARPEDISKVLQLIEPTPFTAQDNIKISRALEIDSDTPRFLQILDIFEGMGGVVVTKNNDLPRIAIYPKSDDKPHENVSAQKSIAHSEYGDFVVIRNGINAKMRGRVLKAKDKKNHFGSGIDFKKIHNFWFYGDLKIMSGISQYNSWIQGIKNEPTIGIHE